MSKLTTIVMASFLLFILSVNEISSQDTTAFENTVSISHGNILFAGNLNAHYERTILGKNKLRSKIRATYSKTLYDGLDSETGAKVIDRYMALSFVQLFGLLELSAGMARTNFTLSIGFDPLVPGVNYDEEMNGYTFIGNVGIRYVRNGFMIRAGLGNLEFLYLGLGFNF